MCIAATAAQQSMRVAGLCKARSHNIATVEWLVGALGGGVALNRMPDLQPGDMICYTAEMEREFAQRFDAYGDSYVGELTAVDLARILDQMDVEVRCSIIEVNSISIT